MLPEPPLSAEIGNRVSCPGDGLSDRLVPLPVFLADEQRPVLSPGVELAGILAPLVKVLPLAGVLHFLPDLVLDEPDFAANSSLSQRERARYCLQG